MQLKVEAPKLRLARLEDAAAILTVIQLAFAEYEGKLVVALNVRIALPGNAALFAALGYREVSRQAHPGFAVPTSIRMEKRLAR